MIAKCIGSFITLGCLSTVYLFDQSSRIDSAFRIFHWPAMVLTGLGPIGLLLLCFDGSRLRSALKMTIQTSPRKAQRLQELDAENLKDLMSNFYSQGSKALSPIEGSVSSPLLKKVVERLRVRMPISDVRSLLERDKQIQTLSLDQNVNFFSMGIRLSPSLGMLGTILGMVQLLASLNDPTNIGSYMSMSLLTTFYGLFFSLLVWTPLQQRADGIRESELRGYSRLSHWLELLEARKPTNYFEEERT